MSNVKQLQEVQDANAAQRILDDKQITNAFEMVEHSYLDAMLTASEKDDLGRFRYSEAIKVLRLVRHHLANTVKNGALSKHELDEISPKKGFF